MFKKLGLALAAVSLLGTPLAAPAQARTDVDVVITLGNKDWYRPYYGRPHDRSYRQYCHPRREVLVQDRRGRLYCISKRDYYRYYDRDRRYDDYGWYDHPRRRDW